MKIKDAVKIRETLEENNTSPFQFEIMVQQPSKSELQVDKAQYNTYLFWNL